uniref:Sugar transporter SWEET1 n=1 Tax=Meloidogyne incognita TaxID=6306 RepID=A0A914KHD9_MELIC
MLDVFHGEFTFIKFISTLAFFTTVGLFFCGIPICRQIWKRKDTDEISGAPFLMGVLGGTCWIVYAYLKGDNTVMYVTGTQILLYSTYTIFYWFMSKKKLGISIKILLLVGICSALVALAHIFGQKVFHPLGIICTTLNTMDFAAPLSGLRVVIRRRATSTLPLPLCIANFMVSTEWFIYGLLVWDFYLITPNGIGSLLAFAQLILFVVLPRKPKQRPPFIRLFYKIRRCCSTEKDIISTDVEAIAVVSSEKDPEDKMSLGIDRISHHRWSSRILTNVVGEVENAIQKVQIGEQFAYSHKLDKSADSSDSGCAESAKTLSPEEHRKIEEHIPSTNAEEEEIDTFNENENAFAESAKSMRLSAKHLQKLAATFGGSGAENLDLGESGELDSVYGHSVRRQCASAMSETANTDRLSNSGLFRLSRRLSAKIQRTIHQQEQPKKRAGYIGGFGYSLQQHHYRALHPKTDQEQTDGEHDDVPIIVETDEDVASNKHQRYLKRAKSEPSLAAKQHHNKHFKKIKEENKAEENQQIEQEVLKEGEKQETNSVKDDKCLLG